MSTICMRVYWYSISSKSDPAGLRDLDIRSGGGRRKVGPAIHGVRSVEDRPVEGGPRAVRGGARRVAVRPGNASARVRADGGTPPGDDRLALCVRRAHAIRPCSGESATALLIPTTEDRCTLGYSAYWRGIVARRASRPSRSEHSDAKCTVKFGIWYNGRCRLTGPF